MNEDKQIVIVGGGFAGTTLATELERRLPSGHRVVLVSEESYTTFNPMLAEVVGASVFPEHVVAPIRQMLDASRGSQFIMGRATAVDRERRLVTITTLAGPREIQYEHLVLAFGTRANLELVPGLAQHALPLKLVGDAMFIRNRVLQRVACIELERDPQRACAAGPLRRDRRRLLRRRSGRRAGRFPEWRAALLSARPAQRAACDAAARPRSPATRIARVARSRRRALADEPWHRRASDDARHARSTARRCVAGGRRATGRRHRDLHHRHTAEPAGRTPGACAATRPHRDRARPARARGGRRVGDRRLRA